MGVRFCLNWGFRAVFMDMLFKPTIFDSTDAILSDVLGNNVILNLLSQSSGSSEQEPRSLVVQPVFAGLGKNSTVTGAILAVIPWSRYIASVLPQNVTGFSGTLGTSNAKRFMYEWNGSQVRILEGNQR